MSGSKVRRRASEHTIPGFFSGRSVFITGGTGFLGKVLIEKLLRSCPEVKRIYLLMRQKKGKDVGQRLKEMLELPLFVRIRREGREQMPKLIPVEGDVSEVGLDMSPSDRELLAREVTVVFHCAASVRFDDPLKKACFMNTRGTQQLLELCRTMTQLTVVVHVSTTYCNTHKSVIEETVYPAPADWRQMINLCENVDENMMNVMSGKILGEYPNTYTYTKALAEHVVMDYGAEVPSAIFRPSIVISSMVEPMPGWVDNFNGPIGLFVGGGKGVVRTVFSDPSVRSDYMPVDLAVRSLIVTAWDRAVNSNMTEERTPIYNCASSEIRSFTQAEIVDVGYYVGQEVPLNNVLWYPGGTVTRNKLIFYIQVLLLHILPALCVDTALKVAKMKPILLSLHRRIFVANMALEYFLMRQWTFRNGKMLSLNSRLASDDRSAFSYDIKAEDIDILDFFKNCAYGGRAYLLKEDNTDLPDAKKHFQRMYWVDRGAKVAFLVVLAYLLVKLNIIQTMSSTLRGVHQVMMTL